MLQKKTMVNLSNVVDRMMTDNLIIQSYVYSYKSKKYWKIINKINVLLSNDEVIVIPKGFYYDMATVPKWLWSLVRPYNDGLIAFLIHDYLYVHQDVHSMNRYEADMEMLIWLNRTNSNKFDNYLRFFFVRLLGWLWWRA